MSVVEKYPGLNRSFDRYKYSIDLYSFFSCFLFYAKENNDCMKSHALLFQKKKEKIPLATATNIVFSFHSLVRE